MLTLTSRLTVLAVAAGLAAVPLASPARAATPAPTTCHGEDATFILISDDGTVAGVPAPGAQVITRSEAFPTAYGTPGRDVVVIADDGPWIDTGAGDDLLCLVGSGSRAGGETGEGADVVDATQRVASGSGADDVDVDLGAGDDTFIGSVGRDSVITGTGADHVATGDGADRLVVATDAGAVPADDLGSADLGTGDDVLLLFGSMAGGITGGGGNDLFAVVTRATTAVDLDPAAGLAVVDGRSTPIAGFARFGVRSSTESLDFTPATWASLRFRGSDAAETLILRPLLLEPTDAVDLPTTGPADVDLGGGDDTFVHDVYVHGRLAGGPGRDTFATSTRWFTPGSRVSALSIDLSEQTYRSPGSAVPRSALLDFEEFDVGSFRRYSFTGSPSAEVLRSSVADFRIDMRGGPDTVVLTRTYIFRDGKRRIDAGPGDDTVTLLGSSNRTTIHGGPGDDRLTGGDRRDRISGAAGDDRLVGGGGPDVLRGGSGRDRATGGPGRDLCVAERRTSC